MRKTFADLTDEWLDEGRTVVLKKNDQGFIEFTAEKDVTAERVTDKVRRSAENVMIAWRERAVDLARRAYQQADLALDKFACDKDGQALDLLALAKQDIESALRMFSANAPNAYGVGDRRHGAN